MSVFCEKVSASTPATLQHTGHHEHEREEPLPCHCSIPALCRNRCPRLSPGPAEIFAKSVPPFRSLRSRKSSRRVVLNLSSQLKTVSWCMAVAVYSQQP